MKRFNENSQVFSVNESDLYFGEMFKNITDEMVPGVYDYYMISNFGRVYNKYMNLILSPGISGSGYLFVYLSTVNGQKPVQIHRLVMLAFRPIENPEKFQVNHIDGVKTNDVIINLEWCTRSENQKHAFRTGLHPRPSNIDEKYIKMACDLLAENRYTNKEIADIVGNGLTISIVSEIKKKSCWKDISTDYEFYQRKGKKFADEFIHGVCEYFSNNPIGNLTVNDHCRNAAISLGYPYSEDVIDCLRKVYTRKHYTRISDNYIY